MGFFDFFGEAANWVGDTAKSAWTTVKDAVVATGKAIKNVAGKVYDKTEQATVVLYNDLVKKPLDSVEGALGGLSKAISSPITWIALAAGAIVLLPMLSKA